MKLQGVDGMRGLPQLVARKLQRFAEREKSYKTLCDLLFEQSENVMAERILCGFRIEKTTYGDCKRDAMTLAKKLKARFADLPSNSVIGLGMDNSLDWIKTFWAILASGHCPLLINLRLSEAQLSQAFRDSGARAVVSDGKAYSIPTVTVSEMAEWSESADLYEWGNEVFFMTSGTTDRVKLCVYTAENFYHQVCASPRLFKDCKQVGAGYKGQLKILALLPLYHVFGFVAVYLWYSFFARTFVFLSDLTPATLLRTVKKCKVTHIFAVPMVWEAVHKAARKTIHERGEKTVKKFEKALAFANKNRALGGIVSKLAFKDVRAALFGDSIRWMISGGSAISQETLSFFNGIGYYLVNGYGMTEIAITSVCMQPTRKKRNLGSIGCPFHGVEYKIGDDGVLKVRSKARASRIVTGDKVVVSDYDEWFHTDDVAKCVDGEYYLLGRMDDVIISSSGENVNPQAVEDGLVIDGVSNKCLAKFADGAMLLLELAAWKDLDECKRMEQEASEYLKKVNLATEVKRIVLTRDKLIEAGDFKLSRKRIAKRFAAGEIQAIDLTPQVAGEWGELERELAEMLAQVLQNGLPVTPGADLFKDLNASSLDYFAFMSEVLDRYNLPQSALEDELFTTVEAVAEFIVKNTKGEAHE